MISVIVCTYNRADLLQGILQSLSDQTIPNDEYEVIVVDNNSIDHSREVVSEFIRQNANMRYCLETKQGLSNARNRGWLEATGEYVAYTDDDCEVPTHWLAIAKEIIIEKSPAVFGGPYSPFYNSPKPKWWKDSYRSKESEEAARALNEGEYLDGGNIFFHRGILQKLGGFDPRFGMTGNKIAFGEESVLLGRIRREDPGSLIYFDPNLNVYHLVHAKKMTLFWHIRNKFLGGCYDFRVYHDNEKLSEGIIVVAGKLLGNIIRLINSLFEAIFWRDRQLYPYFQNFVFEKSFQLLGNIGYRYEYMRSLISIRTFDEK